MRVREQGSANPLGATRKRMAYKWERMELIEEFKKTDLYILCITENKKKGKGELELKIVRILVYTGFDPNY